MNSGERVAETRSTERVIGRTTASRKDTVKTARQLAEIAGEEGELELFENDTHDEKSIFAREVSRSRNQEMKELFFKGFGCHNAGMLRKDRTLVEQMFAAGVIKVLVCTATLAWGVNLPAHQVIIKGTQLYDASAGGFKDLGVLDGSKFSAEQVGRVSIPVVRVSLSPNIRSSRNMLQC